jgi:hypothetical protein
MRLQVGLASPIKDEAFEVLVSIAFLDPGRIRASGAAIGKARGLRDCAIGGAQRKAQQSAPLQGIGAFAYSKFETLAKSIVRPRRTDPPDGS